MASKSHNNSNIYRCKFDNCTYQNLYKIGLPQASLASGIGGRLMLRLTGRQFVFLDKTLRLVPLCYFGSSPRIISQVLIDLPQKSRFTELTASSKNFPKHVQPIDNKCIFEHQSSCIICESFKETFGVISLEAVRSATSALFVNLREEKPKQHLLIDHVTADSRVQTDNHLRCSWSTILAFASFPYHQQIKPHIGVANHFSQNLKKKSI